MFNNPLSDDEMRLLPARGETFFFKVSKWPVIEWQVERLGFEDLYFVTGVDFVRGALTKVSPAGSGQALRSAA